MDEINQIIDEFIDDIYQTLLMVVIQIIWISKDLIVNYWIQYR